MSDLKGKTQDKMQKKLDAITDAVIKATAKVVGKSKDDVHAAGQNVEEGRQETKENVSPEPLPT